MNKKDIFLFCLGLAGFVVWILLLAFSGSITDSFSNLLFFNESLETVILLGYVIVVLVLFTSSTILVLYFYPFGEKKEIKK